MELQPYPVDDDPVGYVEGRQRGKRVIIVIDDFFYLPNWHEIPTSPLTASGLLNLYNISRDWDLTRGIGFFNLPDPTRIAEDSNQVIDCITDWLKELCSDDDEPCQSIEDIPEYINFYVLVDLFFGNNTDITGIPFVTHWKERNILPKDRVKLAYFSTTGTSRGNRDPHHLPLFRKGEIDELGKLPSSLEEWLGFNPVPLEKLWEESEGWFVDAKTDTIKHNFVQVKDFFLNQTAKAEEYKEIIENALGFNFPEEWWQDLETVERIHESLKTLCGDVFCGSTNGIARRNISVGAAYLIALMAHQRLYGHVKPLTRNPSFWQQMPRVTASIFPKQKTKNAKSSAICLYDFFYRLFEPAADHMNKSQVKTAYFDQNGVVLKIQLQWRADKPSQGRAKSLVQMLDERFNRDEIEVPDPDIYGDFAKNSRDAVSRLWRNMMLNDYGFMSPGVIYMEGDELIIASTEDLTKE
jgi:hypothetical protein